MKHILSTLAALALFSAANAGTPGLWTEVSAVDPVSGETIVAHWPNPVARRPRVDMYDEPGSAYLVLWPFTDDHDIWFNPKSGFGAFRLQFEELGLAFDRASLERVRTWLATNYNPATPPRTHLQKLEWIGRIYAQRNMTPDFWSSFYGLMAYEYSAIDKRRSLAYVRKALPLLVAALDDQEGIARAHTLYLLGEFNRQLGNNNEARGYFKQARVVPIGDKDGNFEMGSRDLNQLIARREALMDPARLATTVD